MTTSHTSPGTRFAPHCTAPWSSILTLVLALFVPLLSGASQANAAEVLFDITPRSTTVGRPIRVTVDVKNAGEHDTPSLPRLENAIVESQTPRSMTSMSIVNGRTTRMQSVTYVFLVTPTAEGTLEIPEIAVTADGKRFASPPATIQVEAPRSDDRFIVELSAEPDEVFVGQGVKLTMRIWIRPYVDSRYALRIRASDMWRLLEADCRWGVFESVIRPILLQQQTPRSMVRTRTSLDGDAGEYDVFEFERRIWPLRPGEIDAGEIVLRLSYPTRLEQSRDLFDPGLRVAAADSLVAVPKPLNARVLPLPDEGRPPEFRGAVGRFELRSEVRPTDVAVGEPMTLAVTVLDRTPGGADLSTLSPPPLSTQEDLLNDFRVASDPLAGDVQGWMKSFTTTIRPLRDDVSEVPPIRFAYFDPAERRYREVESDAVAVSVAPGSPLDLDGMVDLRGDEDAERTRTTPNRESGPMVNETDRSQLFAVTTPGSGAVFIAAAAAPPLLFTAFALWWARRRSDLRDPLRRRRRHARRSALGALAPGASSSQVRTALVEFLADLEGLPPGAMTTAEAMACAERLGCPAEARERLAALLDRCDRHSFAPGGDLDASLVDEARAWIESQRPELASATAARGATEVSA